jgi:hypothetical protein
MNHSLNCNAKPKAPLLNRPERKRLSFFKAGLLVGGVPKIVEPQDPLEPCSGSSKEAPFS